MAVAVLMLPVALVVTSFGPWLDTRVWAVSAAAETARAAAIDLDLGSGAGRLEQLTTIKEMDSDLVGLGWCGAEPSTEGAAGTCPLTRGSAVVAEVAVWTPLFVTPWGNVGGLWVRATHSEPIDLYRSIG